jgi:hypothetical protein
MPYVVHLAFSGFGLLRMIAAVLSPSLLLIPE